MIQNQSFLRTIELLIKMQRANDGHNKQPI